MLVACLPAGVHGTTSTTTVINLMLRSFKSLEFGLLAGIGAGIPNKEHVIRRGDVVFSQPNGLF